MFNFNLKDYYNLCLEAIGESEFKDLDSECFEGMFYHFSDMNLLMMRKMLDILIQQKRLNTNEKRVVKQFIKNNKFLTEMRNPYSLSDWESVMEDYNLYLDIPE
jgi:hypothetical protein